MVLIQKNFSEKISKPYILEQNQRLSTSILWDLQRRFFECEGIDAWRQGIVPQYITSNPYIAQAYVHVISGFLRDYFADSNSYHTDQPIYILELGNSYCYIFSI